MGTAEKLTIYRASAGSGKTFQLTREFLSILFKNPLAYKNILAVTFTNKATAEMKGRILSELSKIANDEPSPYVTEFGEELGVKPEVLKARAKTILSNILHDYSRFTIETIDNFFQRVLKSFTKELHIYFNYNLELDTSKIIEQAASRMVFNSHQNKELKQWLTDFALEKISWGKAWNAKKDIISLGRELFNEQFQLTFNKVNDTGNRKDAIREYIKSCNKLIDDYENYLANLGKKALELIQNNGLSIEDFAQKGRGVAGYFEKIANKKESEPNTYVKKASQDFDSWVPKKSSNRDQIEQLYYENLRSLLDDVLQYREEKTENYTSAKEVLKLIYAFGILTDLFTQVREISNEQNIFLLADTGKLIHTIIENNEAPFIYEKLGNVYAHFMIDEFQDTSELQWKNFFPLIQNSLALGKKNIVVGDVKQAIYRWRNSNWNILGSKIYNQINREQLEVINLDKNWRSLKNVVQFNNSIYGASTEFLQNEFNTEVGGYLIENPYSNTIITAYNELKQDLPKSSNADDGYVNIKLINEENWEEQILDELPNLTIDLLNKGYAQSEITFLVRNKTEGKLIIDKLIDSSQLIFDKTGITPNFLSSDALLLKSSKSVRCIISALNYVVSPDDEINKAYLTNFIYEFVNKTDVLLHNLSVEKPVLLNWLDSNSNNAGKQSLYSLVSLIIKKFELESLNEKAFTIAFLDMVLEYSRNNHTNIKNFLNWWDENEGSLSLNLEQADNAIQVLTIHKSKGLEFDAVIIPFCNWRIDQHASHASILWCKPDEEPLNTMPVVPLKYSSGLSKTIFKNEYAFEKLNTYIDNINLLYVATTRAKKALFIRSPHPEQSNRGLSCVSLLNHALTESNIDGDSCIPLQKLYNETASLLEIGKFTDYGLSDEIRDKQLEVAFSEKTFDLQNKLQVKYHHKDFFADNTEPNLIDEGKLLHKIFEKIIYADDVEKAVEQVYMDGLISKGEKENIANYVTQLINHNNVKDWFDKRWLVKTESEILLPGTIQKRPDRILFGNDKVIIIDYKFGLQQSNKNINQVKEYVHLVKEMEYANVEGFVWYVTLNKIEKV